MPANDFLYQKVYDGVLLALRQGKLTAGQKLPSAEQLMAEYAVSRITVNKALSLLVEEGRIRRVPGVGSFVQPQEASTTAGRKPSKLIGIVLEHVSSPFGLAMMYHLDLCAARNGYKTILRFSLGDRERETEEIDFLTGLGIDGLIIMPCHGRHYNPALLKLYLKHFPIVMVDKNMQGIGLPSVRTDNEGAVQTLVGTLFAQGCRCMAFLTSDDTNAISVRERRKGFINGIDAVGAAEAGIVPLPLKNSEKEFLSAQANSAVKEEIHRFLAARSVELDAIVCGEYSIAAPLVAACRAEGLLPERGIRIATIDEDYLAPEGYHFLHMKQDEIAIAEKAVELLLSQLHERPVVKENYLIPAILCKQRPFALLD